MVLPVRSVEITEVTHKRVVSSLGEVWCVLHKPVADCADVK